MRRFRQVFCLVIYMLALVKGAICYGGELLNKTISVEIKKKPLSEALKTISAQGHFYFSYNSNIIAGDSIVSLSVKGKTVKQALDMLLGHNYQFKETENHIIILPLEKWYTVSGYITDAASGQRLADASVFDEQQLASTLTGPDGFFRLRLRDKGDMAARIRASKSFYKDTSIAADRGSAEELTLVMTPIEHSLPGVTVTQYSEMEKTWMARLLISKRIKMQSANLERFFVNRPLQVSVLPGLSTHGRMSTQVSNELSFNVLGGYSAGVKGTEIGGLFNIDKKDVKYAQVAGIFNSVGGSVAGVQVGGIANNVWGLVDGVQIGGIANLVYNGRRNAALADSVPAVHGIQVSGIINVVVNRRPNATSGGSVPTVHGIQVAGIANVVFKGSAAPADSVPVVEGIQTAGIVNAVNGPIHGIQVAGIVNAVNGRTHGIQVAGITNLNRRNLHGLQISGILNTAKKVEGSQIGLINIADSVDGYCLGLVNIAKHGYHVLSLESTDMLSINAAYKAGNPRLYSILGAGMNYSGEKEIYAIRYGIGREMKLAKRLALTAEVTVNDFYPSSNWKNIIVMRLEPALNLRLHKLLSLYAGPVLSFCPDTNISVTDYFPGIVPSRALYTIDSWHNTATWIGWKMGISLF